MKRAFTIITLIFITQNVSAQYFKLHPQGFLTEDKQDYKVLEVTGQKQSQLYVNVLNAINTLYSNPQKGLSTVEGESISLTAYKKKAFKGSGGIMTYDYDVDYTLSFLFKDGKIRVNAPVFEAGFMNYNGTWNNMNVQRSYFKGNGDVKSEKNYKQINDFFNQTINDIIEKAAKVSNW